MAAVETKAPAFAVIDMRLGDGNGLDVIARLKERRPEARGVILTGYGNIATAVTAVKLGAFDYLAKSVGLDALRALIRAALQLPAPGGSDCAETGVLGATGQLESPLTVTCNCRSSCSVPVALSTFCPTTLGSATMPSEIAVSTSPCVACRL